MFATVDLTRVVDGKYYELASWLFVATPTVLSYLGVGPASVDPRSDFLAYPGAAIDKLVIPSPTSRRGFALTNVQRIQTRRRLFGLFGFGFNEVKRYTPPTFITLDGVRRRGCYLSDVPFLYLGLAIVGVPLVTAATGWLLAGREPPAIARPVIQ
jgi:hypothetical protein